jgi:hypothetical protein
MLFNIFGYILGNKYIKKMDPKNTCKYNKPIIDREKI